MSDLNGEYWEFENLILKHPDIPSDLKKKFKTMVDSHRITYVKIWETQFDVKEKYIVNTLIKLKFGNKEPPNKDKLTKIIGLTYYNNEEYKHQNLTSQLNKLQKKGIIKYVKGSGNEKLILLQDTKMIKSLKRSVAWINIRREYLNHLLEKCREFSNELLSQINITDKRIEDLLKGVQNHVNMGMDYIAETNFVFQEEFEAFMSYQIKFLNINGINSEHPKIWFQLGKKFEQEYDNINAFKAYDKAKTLDPNNHNIIECFLRLKSIFHSDSSEITEAINCIERTTNLSTLYQCSDELAMCKYNLGKILGKIGKDLEATKAFQESAELFKKSYKKYNDPRFLTYIRLIYFEINEPEKALSFFGKLSKRSPNNIDNLLELICSYCNLKKFKKTNGLLKKAYKPELLLKKLQILNCALISQNK